MERLLGNGLTWVSRGGVTIKSAEAQPATCVMRALRRAAAALFPASRRLPSRTPEPLL